MSFFGFAKKKASDEEKSGGQNAGPKTSEELTFIKEKKEMIKGIEDLSETSVKEVMIPRIDVDFISVDTSEDELIKKIAESGHSRFPVYSGSIDNILGILYVKDLIIALSKKEKIDLEKLPRKAYSVPESKKIDGLLREFKRRHLHIAVAIDEYGCVSGIVCMEDIIEEIVGDIQDEFDKEEEEIKEIGKHIWLCDARVNLDDLNETICSDFPSEDFDTLGGFVLDLFGYVPAEHEKKTWNSFEFEIQSTEGHRVNLIKIMKKAVDETETAE